LQIITTSRRSTAGNRVIAASGKKGSRAARKESRAAVAQAEARKGLADMGTLVTSMNAKEFGAFTQSEMAKWRDAVKSANVKIEQEARSGWCLYDGAALPQRINWRSRTAGRGSAR
jgi:hypothetical protein